jgi:hypothetical protein
MRLSNLFVLTAVFVTCSPAVEQINWFSNGFTAVNKPNLHTGTVSYSSLNGKLIGANIDIDVLQGLGVPSNSNLFVNCFSCRLSFASGSNVSNTSGTSWTFNAIGSTIQVTGGFDLNKNGVLDASDIQPGAVLLSGVFSTPVSVTTPNLAKPDILLTASTVLNVVNTQLANFYGVPGGYTWNGVYSQTIDSSRPQFATSGAGKGHYKIGTVAMRNGLLTDTLVTPEPTDLLLFTSVTGILMGCVVLRRRFSTVAPSTSRTSAT